MKAVNKILILCRENSEKVKLSSILRKSGYEVNESAIGTIRKDFDRIKPDIIIADYQLESALLNINSLIIYLIEKSELFSLNHSAGNENIAFVMKPITETILQHQVELLLKVRSLESKLHKSEFKYVSFLEQIPVPVFLICNNEIVYVNKEGEKILDSDKEQLLNNDYHKFVSPENHGDFDKFIDSVLSDKKSQRFHEVTLSKSGGAIVQADIELIPSSYQSQPAVQVIVKDFTALRKREKIQSTIMQILLASNSSQNLGELFEFIYKIIEDVIPIKNMYVALYDKNSQLLSFPFYKDEFSEKPKERSLGNGLTEHIIHTHNALLLNSKVIEQMIEDGKIAPSTNEVKSWLGIPLMIHEDIAGVLVIKEYHEEDLIGEEEKKFLEFVSYSIARAIERAINENEKERYITQLQDLNETKDKFFSIISHDLKSPFSSILGVTEILKEQYSDFSKEEVEQLIDALYSSTHNVFNLVDNMLSFSRFQIGLMDFSPKLLNLNSLVKETIQILSGNALKKQIEISINIKDEVIVWAEKDMLNSVIQNLISNSIKFTERGGKINITAYSQGDLVKMIVKDNGIGMNEEALKNIFKLDVKKSTKGTQKEEGTGLGLILVKEYIEKNGGSIEVRSMPGKGSEFIVTLRVKEITENV